MTIVVDDHVHTRGPLEIRVKVDTVKASSGKLAHQIGVILISIQLGETQQFVCIRVKLGRQFAAHMIKGVGQKTATTAGWIKNTWPPASRTGK